MARWWVYMWMIVSQDLDWNHKGLHHTSPYSWLTLAVAIKQSWSLVSDDWGTETLCGINQGPKEFDQSLRDQNTASYNHLISSCALPNWVKKLKLDVQCDPALFPMAQKEVLERRLFQHGSGSMPNPKLKLGQFEVVIWGRPSCPKSLDASIHFNTHCHWLLVVTSMYRTRRWRKFQR